MLNFFQALILGIVQGLTEFIPVSSSAHLVLVPWLLGWPEPGLVFDTMVHWGTLVALLLFFWRDVVTLVVAALASLRERSLAGDPNRRLVWLIALATIPAALAGALFEKQFEALFSEPAYVAVFLLVTGLVLTMSERLGQQRRNLAQVDGRDAALIGIAQAIAIAPGISRSGATISTGLFVGLTREAAARFSFLMAMPIIFGAGLLKLKDFVRSGDVASLPAMLVGFLAALVTGYFCIRFLLAYLRRGTLYPFAVYCWAIGLGVLALIAIGWR